MKTHLSLLIILLTLSSCAQEKKCSDFKNGKFKYANPEYSEWTVTRKDSIQIEFSSKSGIEIHGSVEWTSDCEYVLVYRKYVNAEPDETIGKTLEVEIIETSPGRYICKSKSDDMLMKLEMISVD